MISLTAYWQGRDRQYAGELTDEIRGNASETLGKVNALLERAGFDHINSVNSGWRPRSVNDATSNAGKNSRHITAEAVDIPDPDRRLAYWCIGNLEILQEIGLWMESPRYTPTWVHLQVVPPVSGRTVFIPREGPPPDPDFPVTWPERGSKTERGFIQLPLMAWGAFGAALIILGLGIALKVQTARLESFQAEYAAFKTEVKRLGEEAQAKAKAREASDLKAKEKSDADAKTLRDRNTALARSLRDARAGSRYVPPAPATAREPDRACFDRAELERAVQRLDDEISAIVGEGDAARIDLDTAKTWVKELTSSTP